MKWMFTFLFVCIINDSFSQTPVLSWAKGFGGADTDWGNAIAVDSAGNSYIMGRFSGTADLNPDPAVTTNFTAAGLLDIYFMKVNPAGTMVWVKQIGGTQVETATSIAVDKYGNLFLTGSFTGTIDFNPDPGVTTSLTSSNGRNVYLAKYDTSANLEWVRQITPAASSSLNVVGLAANVTGVYITGELSGTADFNPDPSTSFNLTSAGGDDVFIVKLDTSGNFAYAKRMGGTQSDNGFNITVDRRGNVFATGDFQGTSDLNPDPAVTTNFTSFGDFDIYVTKLDTFGNFVWTRQFGGPLSDYPTSVKTDDRGNVYTIGQFTGIADFNPDPIAVNTLTSAGNQDIFISKLDTFGNFVWVKRIGGTAWEFADALAINSRGLYLTGNFDGTTDFNPDPLVANNLTSAGSYDAFITRLDTAGNFLWARQFGNTGEEDGFGLALDSAGSIYATGGFHATVDFDPGAGTANVVSAGGLDAYLFKLTQPGLFPITLSNFSVEESRCMATLKWRTSSEQNSGYFEVQHCTDGRSFKTISNIQAARNSASEKNYTVTKELQSSKNFFRLRMVDVDGSATFSPIVTVTASCSNVIASYPNPAKNKITITGLTGKPMIRLLDNQGRIVLSTTTANQTEQINVSAIAPGSYLLQVVEHGEVLRNIKVIISR